MNTQSLTSILIGFLLGGTCIFSADFVNAQHQAEIKAMKAYRYNIGRQFIVANKILFGNPAYKNISFLYAYEPSSLEGLAEGLAFLKNSDVKILKPRESKSWWLEPSYEVTGYEGSDLDLSELSKEEAYLAVEEAYEDIEYSDLFVIEQEDDQISANTTSDEGNTTAESSRQ